MRVVSRWSFCSHQHREPLVIKAKNKQTKHSSKSADESFKHMGAVGANKATGGMEGFSSSFRMILTKYMSIILYIVAIVDKLHVNRLYIVAIVGLTFSFSFFTQSSELFIFQDKKLINSFWKLSGIVVVISL